MLERSISTQEQDSGLYDSNAEVIHIEPYVYLSISIYRSLAIPASAAFKHRFRRPPANGNGKEANRFRKEWRYIGSMLAYVPKVPLWSLSPIAQGGLRFSKKRSFYFILGKMTFFKWWRAKKGLINTIPPSTLRHHRASDILCLLTNSGSS